jgi:hypothetical protein
MYCNIESKNCVVKWFVPCRNQNTSPNLSVLLSVAVARIKTNRPCKRVRISIFGKWPRILWNCLCCNYNLYICFPITIILVILQLKREERWSVFYNFKSLEGNTAQVELLPHKIAVSFYTNSRTTYALNGEKAFIVSFNRLILCPASGTSLKIYVFLFIMT